MENAFLIYEIELKKWEIKQGVNHGIDYHYIDSMANIRAAQDLERLKKGN